MPRWRGRTQHKDVEQRSDADALPVVRRRLMRACRVASQRLVPHTPTCGIGARGMLRSTRRAGVSVAARARRELLRRK